MGTPLEFYLSGLSTLSLQQYVNCSSGFSSPILVPAEVSVPVNCDSPCNLQCSLSCIFFCLTPHKCSTPFWFYDLESLTPPWISHQDSEETDHWNTWVKKTLWIFTNKIHTRWVDSWGCTTFHNIDKSFNNNSKNIYNNNKHLTLIQWLPWQVLFWKLLHALPQSPMRKVLFFLFYRWKYWKNK